MICTMEKIVFSFYFIILFVSLLDIVVSSPISCSPKFSWLARFPSSQPFSQSSLGWVKQEGTAQGPHWEWQFHLQNVQPLWFAKLGGWGTNPRMPEWCSPGMETRVGIFPTAPSKGSRWLPSLLLSKTSTKMWIWSHTGKLFGNKRTSNNWH